VLPTAFIHSLKGIPGFDAEACMAAHQQKQGINSIRFNPFKKPYLKEIHFSSLLQAPVSWATDAWYLTERPSFTLDPLLHAGAYYVQETSSMFSEAILNQTIPNPTNEFVLDISAAPGGKTTLLSAYFKHGIVVANEIIKSRAAILSENVMKWGTDIIIVTNNEPRHSVKLSHFFDVILLNAPCSGSGLFRKDKNAVQEWSVENVAACSLRQQKIRKEIIGCLKPGGMFIYSTC
jgi:16S rRNA C967 or C1407 C5-methylase (RsmB/RsmF family)